ncbi:MAG: zinc ribbon domain-containing protein [Chloroflexi bacterium]|jgi:hypothetical protein|nr:zinc ribbon domain-containing protein [Chloroflexota bacterium]MBT7080792.1 zinc ribbon domain-containing protein [Chloroflexota bacterium]MBT7289308.1 zinc ribbon domain-containing protein [Chloroflexota bacterium]
MYCPKCGSQATDGNAFCIRCGAPMSGHVYPTNAYPAREGQALQTSLPNRNGLLTAGAVLLFVSGGIGLLFSIGVILLASLFMTDITYGYTSAVDIVYLIMGLVVLVLSVLAILGGIKTLQRSSFGWALAGSICGIIATWWMLGIPGIIACVFIAISKKEFDAQPQ